MTAHKYVTLECDSCGDKLGSLELVRIPHARKAAARLGWYSKGGHDWCPECKEMYQ